MLLSGLHPFGVSARVAFALTGPPVHGTAHLPCGAAHPACPVRRPRAPQGSASGATPDGFPTRGCPRSPLDGRLPSRADAGLRPETAAGTVKNPKDR
ncbi:hypothetical protein Ssi03_05910 [Sphaerisporangium siamense]|nr:hypothetical protein Ssi03_05910 [Sphaerisporangium siamense]